MNKVYVYDPVTKEMVPKRNRPPKGEGEVVIMKDIEPYKAIGGDMAGKWITSRSKHREFLKRNGFIEVGNEFGPFFEYGGKTRDNPFAERNEDYKRIKYELEGRSKRGSRPR